MRSDFSLNYIVLIVYAVDRIRLTDVCLGAYKFRKNLNASKPSEHPPQVEECLKV